MPFSCSISHCGRGSSKQRLKASFRVESGYSKPLAMVQKNWANETTSWPCWRSDATACWSASLPLAVLGGTIRMLIAGSRVWLVRSVRDLQEMGPKCRMSRQGYFINKTKTGTAGEFAVKQFKQMDWADNNTGRRDDH